MLFQCELLFCCCFIVTARKKQSHSPSPKRGTPGYWPSTIDGVAAAAAVMIDPNIENISANMNRADSERLLAAAAAANHKLVTDFSSEEESDDSLAVDQQQQQQQPNAA